MLVDHSYFQISASSSLMMMTIRKKRSIVDNIWIYTGWNDKYCIYQLNEYNYKYRNVLCQFCKKKNKVSILRASGNMLQRQVKEEIELCNFLKCHSTSRKRVQHQILIQCESFWPSRSCICQKLISPGNSRFLTCCENIWPPRSLSYLSTNFSLGLTFVSLIKKDCTRRVTQRDEQSKKLLKTKLTLRVSNGESNAVIFGYSILVSRIYVQFSWLEDNAITMIFCSPAAKWLSSFLCAHLFTLVLKLWSTRVLGPVSDSENHLQQIDNEQTKNKITKEVCNESENWLVTCDNSDMFSSTPQYGK